MKKIISLVLFLTVLSTMCVGSFNVQAASGLGTPVYENNGIIETTYNGKTVTCVAGSARSIVDGTYGKPSTDDVLNYSRTNTTAFFSAAAETSGGYVMSMLGSGEILVVEFQFMTNSNVSFFQLLNSGGSAVSSDFGKAAVTSDYFIANQWNNLKLILDVTNNKASLYVNGKKFEHKTGNLNPNTGALRFTFGNASSADLGVYYDNIRMYETTKSFTEVDTGFEYPVTASTASYTYDPKESTIYFGGDKTLGEIKTILNLGATVNVRGYSAAGFAASTALNDTDTLVAGSKLVLEKDSGEIQTLTIAESSGPIAPPSTVNYLYENSGNTKPVGTTSAAASVSGIKGKKANDNIYEVTKNSAGNALWFGPKTGLTIPDGNLDVVYEFSFFPTADMKNLRITDHGGSKVIGTDNISMDEFKMNSWNKVKVVWDRAKETGEIFINGKLYKEDLDMSTFSTLTTFRVYFYFVDNSYDDSIYVDDIYVYSNTDMGAESVEEAYSLPSTSNYIIDSSRMLLVNAGGASITVDALKTAFNDEDTEIRIYSANYASEITAGTTALANDNLIVVEAPNNIFVTYTFKNAVESNMIYFTDGGVKVKPSKNAVLVMCQIDKDGKLVNGTCKVAEVEAGVINTVSYTTSTNMEGILRVMILEDLTSAVPLAEKAEVPYSTIAQ